MNPNGMHGMQMTLDLDKGIVRIKAQDLATSPTIFYSINIHKDGVICLTYSNGTSNDVEYNSYDIRSTSGHPFEGIIFLLYYDPTKWHLAAFELDNINIFHGN